MVLGVHHSGGSSMCLVSVCFSVEIYVSCVLALKSIHTLVLSVTERYDNYVEMVIFIVYR